MASAERVAIVDPYSAAKVLAQEFRQRGYECLAVQSAPSVPAIFQRTFHPEHYVAILPHTGDIAATASALRREGVRHLLAGCDLGVTLADELSECLGLPSNGARMRSARRNKLLMTEAVREHGLRTGALCSSRRLDDLLAWVRRRDVWPVIVKPAQSTASDNVHLCASEPEVAQAFEAILDRDNILGQPNTLVLAQEFLQGDEYIVDTVSYAGKHRIAAFWRYGKPAGHGKSIHYDSMELLPYAGEIQDRLFEYVRGVLDALEIRYGPAHCELMWTDGEPVLVEIGARLTAGNNGVLSRLCGGPCALDMTVDACIDPERFLADADRPLNLASYALNCFLIPPCKGVLQATPGLAEIERLPSLQRVSISAKVGQPVPRVAGIVTLIHPEREVLGADLRRIRELVANGLFEIDAS